MSRLKSRTMRASADEDMDPFQGFDLDDGPKYRAPKQHMGRSLRNRNIPYNYVVTDEQVFEGLEWKLPIGVLKPLSGRSEEVKFENVKYAGGYVWKEPLMRDQLGVDHRALGERVFVTPAIPDVLGDPSTIGRVDSDQKSGMIDYIIDVRDASFLRPTFSPFESLFRSLVPCPTPGPILDSLDMIVDHSTLLHIINFLQDPSSQVCRTDCQFTSEDKAVVMHHWLPKIMYGAGEPHRGYVQSYTRRVTAPCRTEAWNGGTTQMVRYDLGGIGMLVRYPVQAMVGSQPLKEEVNEHTFNTKKNVITNTVIANARSDTKTDIDRTRFMAIKVLNTDPRSYSFDLDDLYIRLLLTQSDHCLIAPHYKGDFHVHDKPFEFVNVNDPIFQDTKTRRASSLQQAIGVWRNMVLITRKLRRNVSFVGNEDGTIQVLGMKRGPYEHVNLSDMALRMLDKAAPSELEGKLQGYSEYDRTKTVGNWAVLNSEASSTVTWGEE